MKAQSTAKSEQSRHQGSRDRGDHGHGQPPPLAVLDGRPEMAQQQSLLSLMAASPRLQRKCACGAPSAAGGSCATCEGKENSAKPVVLQKQLAIGAADDPLEREADRVADQVMGMGLPSQTAQGPTPQRIQRLGHNISIDGNEVAPASVVQVLAGSGRPLEAGLRQEMELRFGQDFSSVRVHTDTRAARSAQDVDALAYTVGQNIVFGAGQFAPKTSVGRRLLAHELTHTVQQSAGSATTRLQRQRCEHDGKGTACGASNGVWKLVDEAAKEAFSFSIDDLVVEGGLASLGGSGRWARQVQSPPNLVKSEAASRGRIDGVKVKAGATLDVEIVEVKARSNEGGGCARGTVEANGYINELKTLAPLIPPMSAKLAAGGGLKVEGGRCKTPKAADKKTLEAAGVDFNNPSSVNAWCFYNSLQDRLGTLFTTPFAAVNISANADGIANHSYDIQPPVVINCRKTKANPTGVGLRYLQFQVNNKGGVSYGCRDVCYKKKEKEEDKEDVVTLEDRQMEQQFQNADKYNRLELPSDQPQRPDVAVKPTDTKTTDTTQPPSTQQDVLTSDVDTDESNPVQLPSGGVSEVDALKMTVAVVATVAVLHQSMKYVKTKAEKELARRLIEKTIQQGMEKGALQIAKKLDSANIVKYGTREGDLLIKGADEAIVIAAKASPRLAPQVLKVLPRAASVIGIVLAANDARAAISHVSKGGTIELGPSLDDVDLSGDTQINAIGPEGKTKPSGDVSLKDTKIDIETKTVPNVTGSANIEADKVTIRGAAVSDGSPVMVNMKVKLSNTTVTLKSTGFIQNGKVSTGDLDIKDSQIEIDLPPGTLDPGRKSGETKTISGQKIKITSLSGGGGAGAMSTPGATAVTPTPAMPNPTPGMGTTTPGTAAPTPATGMAGTLAPPPLAGPNRPALIQQIQADKDLLKIYQALAGKEGIVPSDELLSRFVALKPMIKRHPAAVETVVKNVKPGQITDPIKEIIEPIEQTLQQENAKLGKKLEQSLAAATPSTPGTPTGAGTAAKPGVAKATDKPVDKDKPGAMDKPGDKAEVKPSDKDSPSTGGGTAATQPPTATAVKFSAISGQLEWPTYEATAGDRPPVAYNYGVRWTANAGGTQLIYKIELSLKFKKNLPQVPEGKYGWLAEYEFTPPDGIFTTEQGDVPIQFSDAGNGTYTTKLFTTKPPK